ncbi:MAG: calcium-binding protein [Pseudochelatococcus sp.]|jgi:Ca2+-binding RTX toxin-like protein|uniref:calcium-binding protein n=1 Tax=Pseudochelatococcus sp. TaxID=2020869 RepID=UPI003D8ADC05
MTSFVTSATITSGWATNIWNTQQTASLAGKRTTGNLNRGILQDDGDGILNGDHHSTNKNDAIIYDLLFNGGVNEDKTTQRFVNTFHTFNLGEGSDILDLTVNPQRQARYDIPDYALDVTAVGWTESDTIWSGSGNDHLYGDAAVYGFAEDFSTPWLQGFGADTIHGGDGNDAIYGDAGVFRFADGNFVISARSLPGDLLDGGKGDDTIYGDIGEFEVTNGFLANRRLNFGGDTIDGDDGNDVLYGDTGGFNLTNATTFFQWIEFGFDTIRGGKGNDVIYGDVGALDLAGGNVIPYLFFGSDILDGGDGNDTIYGDAGAFTPPNGSSTGDELVFGNDRLTGGAGNDHLWGDGPGISAGGTDTFIFGPGSGQDTIHDFRKSDADKIDVSAYATSFAALTISTIGSADTLVKFDGVNSVLLLGVTNLTASDFIF